MNRDTPEALHTVGNDSVGGDTRQGPGKKVTGGVNSGRSKSINYCSLSSLPVIGDKLCRKKENMVRFYFENVNGIRNHAKGVDKGKKFRVC